jgi:hypothetical protein
MYPHPARALLQSLSSSSLTQILDDPLYYLHSDKPLGEKVVKKMLEKVNFSNLQQAVIGWEKVKIEGVLKAVADEEERNIQRVGEF